MAYFLRQEKKKKGIYLQMYETYWDREKKQPRSKSIMAFGYVDELISDAMPDPIAYFKEYVKQKNEERAATMAEETRPRAFASPVEKNIGHFLLHSLLMKLNVKETIDILATQMGFGFNVYDMMTQLIYARVLCPCSQSGTVSDIFPHIYHSVPISEAQVDKMHYFIGESYKKYIELFNRCYRQRYKRDFSKVFFDCTNYYFETEFLSDYIRKSTFRENRRDPIIGQVFMLDADLVPLAMQMYPGNKSERPYIRKIIDEMKKRYKVVGRTVQVADMGLNCARNIYAAVKEANDGYIFSKSIHGRNLSEAEKAWITLENNSNVFINYTDREGRFLFRLKSCVDTFSYQFNETDPETGEETTTTFSVTEKRVVSFNLALAKKQRAEIIKMVDKASDYIAYGQTNPEDLGESVKYIKVIDKDKQGNRIKPVIGIDRAKVEEDLRYVGYNLLVTSELDMKPFQIYITYHDLRKMEESFRITKSYLNERPLYLEKKETIYGYFLISYLSLFLLRILEIKTFRNQIHSDDLIRFMRDFRIVDKGDGFYVNISGNQALNEKIKGATGLTNLDALFFSEREVEHLFNNDVLPYRRVP